MNWFEFTENVLIIKHEHTNALVRVIEKADLKGVIDVVGSDAEVAVQYNDEQKPDNLIHEIDKLQIEGDEDTKCAIFELPVCYELAEDLEDVLEITGLNKLAFIKSLGSVDYQATFGFIPGFIYLSGLPEQLHCPRKQTPRTKIEAGSVGIGGGETGVYSLESPGGWQIIGRTPLTLFDVDKTPPCQIPSGGYVKFMSISKEEFYNWNGGY